MVSRARKVEAVLRCCWIDLHAADRIEHAALSGSRVVVLAVIVHVGHAIGTIDPEEAAQTLALFAQLDAMASAEAAASTGVGA